MISWFPLAGSAETLAIVNIHAINFDLALAGYRAQLTALANVVAQHHGPIIFAGDFNTWSAAREATVAEVLSPLGLHEVRLPSDERSVFLGRHVDHIFVRGLHYAGGASHRRPIFRPQSRDGDIAHPLEGASRQPRLLESTVSDEFDATPKS